MSALAFCLATGMARAGDGDAPPDVPLKDKILRNIGLGGGNDGDREIDYRERSPLVVPRTRDLPPPETGDPAATTANWPKDPVTPRKKVRAAVTQQPGTSDLPERKGLGLDFDKTTFLNAFSSKKKAESVPFKAEPPRQTLTMPPEGYQTPSPAFAYGTGPTEQLVQPAAAGTAPAAATAEAKPAGDVKPQ